MAKNYNIFDFDLTNIIPNKVYFNNIDGSHKALKEDTVYPELKTSIKINEKDGYFILFMGIVIYINEAKESKLLDIDYNYRFDLRNEDDYNEESFKNIDIDLVTSLIAVTYSTFRGNFFERIKSSPFSNFSPLPIINARQIAKHQYSFDRDDLLTEEEE